MARIPLLLSIPHGGSMLPRELAPRFALSQAELFYESDPWTRELFAMGEMVQGRLEAEIARCVVDLDCDPNLRPPEHQDGVCKVETDFGKTIWEPEGFPSNEEIDRLLDRYHRPFHEVLSRTANRGAVRLGIDCHSMLPEAPPRAHDHGQKRPWFCISNFGDEDGEGDDITCPVELMVALKEAIEKEFGEDDRDDGVELVAMNNPYRGGYILDRHGRGYTPWIRLSINQAIYLQQTGDLTEVPDSDRELIATIRRRLLKVLATFAESLD